jgi:aspartyl-tRNA(Asn)/glutamyl-tRNA(Gln) amidotransferase subunit C
MVSNMKETIRKMAHLARLSFPEADLARYTEKVSSILEYVKQLEGLDTKQIEPMSHAIEVTGWLRDDVIVKPILTQEIITVAPERDGMFYQVPRVIDEQ